jgi:hypothetical protein
MHGRSVCSNMSAVGLLVVVVVFSLILQVCVLLRVYQAPRNKQEAGFTQRLALRLRPSTFWKPCIQRQLHTNAGNEQRPQSQEFEQRLAAIISTGRKKQIGQ